MGIRGIKRERGACRFGKREDSDRENDMVVVGLFDDDAVRRINSEFAHKLRRAIISYFFFWRCTKGMVYPTRHTYSIKPETHC